MSSVEKLSSKCIKENISFGVWEPEIGVNLSNSWHCFGGYKQSLRTRISMWDIIIFCFFYCHIRKVILSIVEEHSCTVYAAPLTANGTNKKQFFSLQKARSMSSTGQKKPKKKTKDRIYKHYKTEWLRKTISTRKTKLRNMQPFSFARH